MNKYIGDCIHCGADAWYNTSTGEVIFQNAADGCICELEKETEINMVDEIAEAIELEVKVKEESYEYPLRLFDIWLQVTNKLCNKNHNFRKMVMEKFLG